MKSLYFHRSVRKYSEKPVDDELIAQILDAAIRASNTGNMQLYSIIVTTDAALRSQLMPLHFNQSMAGQAPLLFTFCADLRRFTLWCQQRGAEPGYTNFLWFMNAATDAILACQNACMAAEEEGLGICYLGTVLYNAREISAVLSLPSGVIPVASVVMGYPDENPPMTDRLPVEGVVHWDTYKDYDKESIDLIYKEREESDETARLLKINEKENLAQVFTQNRYKKADNEHFSEKLLELLREQGFLP